MNGGVIPHVLPSQQIGGFQLPNTCSWNQSHKLKTSSLPSQLRHKAAEVIRQQLETRETALLYCMLGDATDEVEHYERALAMTEGRSARAHRALGMHHYFREEIQ